MNTKYAACVSVIDYTCFFAVFVRVCVCVRERARESKTTGFHFSKKITSQHMKNDAPWIIFS